MTDIDTGLNIWQMTSNHNRMIDLQADKSPARDGPVDLAFYGSSAFRITSPKGVSVMIDPWRNHHSRNLDWYFEIFLLQRWTSVLLLMLILITMHYIA